MELSPSQVRKLVLDGHASLRKITARIESELAELSRGDGVPEDRFVSLFSDFSTEFLAHIDLEDRVLRATLESIDAWGAVRAGQLDAEHAEQRAEIDELNELLNNKKPSELVPRFREFFDRLREDMAAEEQELLNPDLLRDDVISIGSSSG